MDIAGLMRVWTTRMGYPYLTVSTAIYCQINRHCNVPVHSLFVSRFNQKIVMFSMPLDFFSELHFKLYLDIAIAQSILRRIIIYAFLIAPDNLPQCEYNPLLHCIATHHCNHD